MEPNPSSQETRLHFLDYWRVIKTRKVIVFLVFLLVVLTVFTITLFQPKIYVASTRIKIEPEKPFLDVFVQSQTANYDPYFLQTQYEIIQSQKILYPVIQRIGLQKIWGGGTELPLDFAFRRLKGSLACRRFRDTSLIEIAVYDRDPRLAAEIANIVAEVFESARLDVKKQQTQKGIDKLRDQVAEQAERLRLAQEKVQRLRRELEVPVIGKDIKLDDMTLQQLGSQLTAARGDAAERKARLDGAQELTALELRSAVATIISDPTVQTLRQNLVETETALESMKEDYGPDHPSVRSMIARRDKLSQQLDEQLTGIKRGFEINYQTSKAKVDELQKQLDDAKNASLVLESEKYLPFRNAQREEDLETRLYDVVKSRLQQVLIEMVVPRSPVEVIDSATPPMPQFYVKPNIWLNVSMGAAFGIVLGIGLAFFIEFLDTSFKKIDDVEKRLGLPVLGVIGQQATLLTRGNLSVAHLEAYRMLRTNIEFAKPEDMPMALCVISAGAGEGKSFTIANLAYVYAQHGSRVLVVDSDLRRPNTHEYLGVTNHLGLADYLAGTKTVAEIIQPSNVPNISVIAAGGGQTTKAALPLLTSRRMEELIEQVGRQFEVVLYDTPPILGVSDAAIMAREVGTSILVIQHRRYPRNMAARAVQIIQNAGGKILGVVVNNVQIGHDETYYYYHDQLEHYQHPTARTPQPVAAAKPSASDEIDISGKY